MFLRTCVFGFSALLIQPSSIQQNYCSLLHKATLELAPKYNNMLISDLNKDLKDPAIMAKARDLLNDPKFVAEFRAMMKTPAFSAMVDESRTKQAGVGQEEPGQVAEQAKLDATQLQEKTEAAIASSETLEDLQKVAAAIQKDALALEQKAKEAIAKGNEDLERLQQMAASIQASLDAMETGDEPK